MFRRALIGTFVISALVLVFSAGIAQAAISVTASPDTAAANAVGTHVFITTNSYEVGGTVLIEIIRDVDGDGVIDVEDWTTLGVGAVDNKTIKSDPEGPQFVGDNDPTDYNMNVIMVDIYDYHGVGAYIVRATNSQGETATDTLSITAATPPLSLLGTVTDSVTTNPISEVAIFAYVNGTGMVSMAFTDGSGNFSLPLAVEGPIWYYVFKDGYVGIETVYDVPPGGDSGLILNLRPSDAQISGTITDYDTGSPILGMTVYADNISGDWSNDVYTDPNGDYSAGVASGEDWNVSVDTLPGYMGSVISDDTYNYDSEPIVTAPGIANFIAFKELAWINGTVKDEYGSGIVQGALFYANRTNTSDPMLQNLGDGEYTNAAGIAEVGIRGGDWNVGLCMNCHEYTVYVDGVEKDLVPPAQQTISIVNGQTIDLTLQAYYADGMLEGYVYASDGITPVSDASVSAWSLDPLNGPSQTSIGQQINTSTETDENGYFKLPVLGGEWTIKAEMYEWDKQSAEQQFTITSNGDEIVGNYGVESYSSINLVLNLDIGGGGVWASPSGVDFGDVVVSSTAKAKLVTLTNNSDGPVLVSGQTIQGTDAGLFAFYPALTNPCGNPPFALAQGQSCGLIVNITPDSLGAKSASLDIYIDNDLENPVSVSLSGNGVNPPSGSISGTVTYGGIQTGVVYATAFTEPISCDPPNQDPPYYVELAGGSPYSYTLSGLPDGTYYVGAVLITDLVDEEILDTDPFGVYGDCDTSTPIVINGSTPSHTGKNIAMVDGPGNPLYDPLEAEAYSQHWDNGYYVHLWVDDNGGTIDSVMVNGPGISGEMALVYNASDMAWRSWDASGGSPYWSSRPTGLPFVYNFTIDDSVQGVHRTYEVDEFLEDYATDLNPANGQVITTSTPALTWSNTGVAGMIYQVDLRGYDDGVWWNQWDVSSGIVYDGPPLTDGNIYEWQVWMEPDNYMGGSSVVRTTFIYNSSGAQPDISSSPPSYDYGNVNVWESSSNGFEVSNNGTEKLVIGSVFIDGAEASQFNITYDNCSGMGYISPGSSCWVDVNFEPTLIGIKSGYLVIASNDPDTSQLVIPLAGYGTEQAPLYEINVYIAGSGVGNVYGSGIDCGNGGVNCWLSYDEGTYIVLTATPDGSSSFTGWSGIGSGCVSGSTNPCSFNIGINTSITATFDVSGTHTITATVVGGVGGTITPSGSVVVDDGGNKTFTITPDAGYYIGDVVVDSVSQGKLTGYTFTNVTANHTIDVTFASLNTIAAMASVGDVNGNLKDDIAVLVTTYTGGHFASIRDGQTKAEIRRVFFGDQYEPIEFFSIGDLNGNGYMELVYFGRRTSTGELMAQVVDAGTGVFVRGIWFNKDYAPAGIIAIPDISGNGKEELAMLGVNQINGQLVVQIADASTGGYVRGVWFNKDYVPYGMVYLPDMNSNTMPELAVLGTSSVNGQRVVQIEDASTGAYVRGIWFNKDYAFDGFSAIPDANGNNSQELVVLGTHTVSGQRVAQVLESATSQYLRTVFFHIDYAPYDLLVLPDMDANPGHELVSFGANVSGTNLAQCKDALSGLFVRNDFYDSNYQVLDVGLTGDLTGDGQPEVAMLGEHKTTGEWAVLVKDPTTGTLVVIIDYPNH